MPDVANIFWFVQLLCAGVPEWSNGLDLRSNSLVLAQVRILSPTFYKMDRKKSFLFLLIVLLFVINYSWIDSFLEKEFSLRKDLILVTRIVDGDTVEISSGDHIRLLGINTPERGEKYYKEAKEFLESLILNQSVELEYGKDKTDLYGRILGYLFLKGKNVNKEIVEEGFANIYFPSGKDKHYNSFLETWKNCVNKKINLCSF